MPGQVGDLPHDTGKLLMWRRPPAGDAAVGAQDSIGPHSSEGSCCDKLATVEDRVGHLVLLRSGSYDSAKGRMGEPVPPRIFSGAATNKNSQTRAWASSSRLSASMM